MTEWQMILTMALSGTLFSVGGTGFKPARRFILPFLLALMCFWNGFIIWKCIVICAGLMIAFCLPYGSKTSYKIKFLTACAMTLPTIVLGFSWWQIITPLLFMAIFWLSNFKLTANIFKWKICEFLIGTLVGANIASLLK